MKEKGLGRSKNQNRLVTLTLLPYYMAVVTTKINHTTNTRLIISKVFQNLFVVSKITKNSEK